MTLVRVTKLDDKRVNIWLLPRADDEDWELNPKHGYPEGQWVTGDPTDYEDGGVVLDSNDVWAHVPDDKVPEKIWAAYVEWLLKGGAGA